MQGIIYDCFVLRFDQRDKLIWACLGGDETADVIRRAMIVGLKELRGLNVKTAKRCVCLDCERSFWGGREPPGFVFWVPSLLKDESEISVIANLICEFCLDRPDLDERLYEVMEAIGFSSITQAGRLH